MGVVGENDGVSYEDGLAKTPRSSHFEDKALDWEVGSHNSEVGSVGLSTCLCENEGQQLPRAAVRGVNSWMRMWLSRSGCSPSVHDVGGLNPSTL